MVTDRNRCNCRGRCSRTVGLCTGDLSGWAGPWGGQLRVKLLFSFFGPDLIISGSPAPRPLHVWKPKAREGSRSTS